MALILFLKIKGIYKVENPYTLKEIWRFFVFVVSGNHGKNSLIKKL